MVTIKTTKTIDKYGIETVQYKSGRKVLAQINLPNKWNGNKFRTYIPVTRNGGVGGDFSTLEDAQNALRRHFEGVFFGNVIIN